MHVFAGGKAEAGDAVTELPGDKPHGGALIRNARRAAFTSPDGRSSITARSASGMGLQDERLYNTDAFLLTQGRPRGKLRKGDTWKVELTIRLETR